LSYTRDSTAFAAFGAAGQSSAGAIAALSSTFPVGEKFFMTAVRHYRNGAPAPLREQIDDFVYQESMHTREHVFFNRQARDAGYDIAPCEDRAARTIAWARARWRR